MMAEVTENIGFIGGGAMAYAVAMGMINGGKVRLTAVFICNGI